MSCGYRCSSAAEPPPRLPLFLPSCSHYKWCNLQLYAFSNMPLSLNCRLRFVCDLVSQWRNIFVPPLTLSCRITLKDDRITTLCTPWTTPSITIVRNSYVYAQNRLHMPTAPNSEVDITNILKLL